MLYYKRMLVFLFIGRNFHIHLVISLADPKWVGVFGFVIVVCLFSYFSGFLLCQTSN